jgi:hypothetical protein
MYGGNLSGKTLRTEPTLSGISVRSLCERCSKDLNIDRITGFTGKSLFGFCLGFLLLAAKY